MRADPGKPMPVKVVKVKPVVVKAPAGDVASSGGDYGMKQANQAARSAPVKRAQRAVYDQQPTAQKQRIVKNASGPVAANLAPIHAGRVARNQELAASAATKDTKGNQDRQAAQSYLAAHPEILKPPKPSKGGSLLATVDAGARLGAKLGAVAMAPAIAGTLKGIDAATGSHTLDFVGKTIGNAPKDTAELITTTPTSLVKLGDTAIHHPEKVPGMLAEPYKQLIKDPGKAISEHPVQTALMLDPAIKVPGRVVGKGLRMTGKQTLERAPKTLPGTALKDTRTKSRDAVVNLLQTRADKKRPAPTMSTKDVQRRVDEFHDFARQHSQSLEAKTVKAIKKRYADLPKDQRKVIIADRVERARVAARGKTDKMFAQEFGANARPSAGAAERNAAATVRQGANQRVKVARKKVEVAQAQHTAAMTEARLALAKSKRSPQLDALEAQHRLALTEVARAKQAQQTAGKRSAVEAERSNTQVARAVGQARVSEVSVKQTPKLKVLEKQRRQALTEVAQAKRAQDAASVKAGVAKGRSQVLIRNIGGGMAGGRGLEIAGESVAQAGERVKAARDAVHQVEQALSVERQRIKGVAPAQQQTLSRALLAQENAQAARNVVPSSVADRVRSARQAARDAEQALSAQRGRMAGVPPAQHDALMKAMAGETGARAELGAARAERQQARGEHIAAKQALTNSTLVDPAQAGRLFEHKADARAVIKRLPVDQEGKPTFTITNAGGKYAAVPKVATKRLAKQRVVGSSPAVVAKVMRRSRQALTQAVLPTSVKWLGGQAAEAGVRATLAGAGPMDVLRINKVVKDLNKQKPGAGDELLMRVSGGQFGLTGTAREFAVGKRSLADEFAGTSLERPAKAASRVGQTLPARAAQAGWGHYTRAVFDGINGAIENTARKAMAGQALKNSPLMDRSILGLSDKAIHDAANGLRATENQVALARAVDRMYGQYQKFSPERRSLLLHWTPFLPWYLNTVTFLTKVLPVDHPIHAALVADASAATEDWRKAQHLSWFDPNHRPDWMMAMGGYPTKDGSGIVPVGKLTPFGIGSDPAQTLADLTLPQFSGPWKNLGGVDWKWQRLKYPGYSGREFSFPEKTLRAVVSGAESQVPVASTIGKLTGLTPRYVDHKETVPTTGQAAAKLINPLAPVTSANGAAKGSGVQVKVAPIKLRPIKVKPVKIR